LLPWSSKDTSLTAKNAPSLQKYSTTDNNEYIMLNIYQWYSRKSFFAGHGSILGLLVPRVDMNQAWLVKVKLQYCLLYKYHTKETILVLPISAKQ
jgi:hypothetical protein